MGLRDAFRRRKARRRNPNQDCPQAPGNAGSANEESPSNGQPSTPSASFIVTAIRDYMPTYHNEFDLSKGDLLRVLDASEEFWRAKNLKTKQEGLISPDNVTSDMSRSNSGKAFFDVDRLGAEQKLLMPGVQFGTYLLRPCEQPGSPFCLSIRANGVNIKHFRVFYDTKRNRFHLFNAMMFASLEELISYYQSNLIDDEVGLVKASQSNYVNQPPPPPPAEPSTPRSPFTEKRTNDYCVPRPAYDADQYSNAADTPPNRVQLQWNSNDCLIEYEDVTLERELNRGKFGVVYLGSMRSTKVAVKKSLTTTSDEAFYEEARVMHMLSHPHIVRLLGFCCDAPDGRPLIITEYMPNGALLDYLHTAAGRSLAYRDLISIIDQVVKAMVYLEEKRVVHRDLRAANVRVDADGSVKVADFGLAKILGSGRNSTEGTFPIRWTAPEAMVEGYEPNTKADVWSFGVLMFEILTYGKVPFEEYTSTSQLQKYLSEGGRLPSPRSLGFQCEDSVYSIMQSYWEPRPDMRPSFATLSHSLKGLL